MRESQLDTDIGDLFYFGPNKKMSRNKTLDGRKNNFPSRKARKALVRTIAAFLIIQTFANCRNMLASILFSLY